MGTRAGAPNTPPNGPPPSPIQTSPNLVHFDPKLVVPTQPIYLQRNDFIYLGTFSNTNGAQVRMTYRYLTPEGEIKEGQYTPPPFLVWAWTVFPLFEGWLLSFQITQITAPVAGQLCYAIVALGRGAVSAVVVQLQGVIWQGYVPSNMALGWPGTPSKEITDGPGILRTITGTQPGAGTDINEVVPTQRRWQLLSFCAILTTSATVANRNAEFVFRDQLSNILHTSPSFLNQLASTVLTYFAAQQPSTTAPLAGGVALQTPMPVMFKTGHRLQTLTANLQATDQWSTPIYTFLEWGMWDT